MDGTAAALAHRPKAWDEAVPLVGGQQTFPIPFLFFWNTDCYFLLFSIYEGTKFWAITE
jgi:hypothetical protein